MLSLKARKITIFMTIVAVAVLVWSAPSLAGHCRGGHANWPGCSSPPPSTATLGDLDCIQNQVARYNGTAWECANIPPDTSADIDRLELLIDDLENHIDSLHSPDNEVFMTLAQSFADMGGLEGADAICNESATNAGLTGAGNFKAWLSDGSLNGSVAARFNHSGRYVLVNGPTIAFDWDDLTDNSILTRINRNEFGDEMVGFGVWTGTEYNGEHIAGFDCDGWHSSNPFPVTPMGAYGQNHFLDALGRFLC